MRAAHSAGPADGATVVARRTELVVARIRHACRLLAAVRGADRIAKMPVTLALNANVCNTYPRVASAALDADSKFMGHGFLQGPMHKVENPADAIKRSVETIAKLPGSRRAHGKAPASRRPRKPSTCFASTASSMSRDWVIRRFAAGHRHASRHHHDDPLFGGDQRHRHPCAATSAFRAIPEALHRPVQIGFIWRARQRADYAISIHPYIAGVPHRIKYLEALLDYVLGHDGVALMTASEVGDWYRSEMAKK